MKALTTYEQWDLYLQIAKKGFPAGAEVPTIELEPPDASEETK